MAEGGFKLPGDSYEHVVRIIRGYAPFKEAVGPADVAKRIATDQTVVSRNNGFLVSAGILEGGKKKSLSELGKRLATALDHGLDNEVSRAWLEVMDQNEFLQGVVSAVKIRNGMDSTSLVSHVAYSAGVGRSPRTTAGAKAVVEILKAASVLEDADGKLVLSETSLPEHRERLNEVHNPDKPPGHADSETLARRVAIAPTAGVAVTIEVRVDCSVRELDELGEKLKSLLTSLQETAGDAGK